ncbi:unnamed protein product [Peniophora sp. CBMAI 1063]|nr:unnamed protein product [Peniophora sp. CBMAI 1063]
MSSRPAQQSPPPVGTRIDDGAIELTSVLGYGGYGVVYRAVDVNHNTFAVKCLIHSSSRSAQRQRRLHLQEITLHELVSAHPHVVTLHRVIEEDGFTFIVMDYCPDGDLFSQILHHRRYLGHDALIKHVFLQLLDAVGYCHAMGVYHRDLKPENVLCFNSGLRLALTDFGLATTDRTSDEFRTGSVYHMSPECQGGAFAPSGSYSPPYNDIWSLGIILLNLITGRNPWKSASASDPTFQAYLQDPVGFLPSVLPISDEVNEIMLQTLDVNWRSRITLNELREAIKGVHTFYAEDVVFEGSMARCAWEVGVDIGGETEPEVIDEKSVPIPANVAQQEPVHSVIQSTWSADSSGSPDLDFADAAEVENDFEDGDEAAWAVYEREARWSRDDTSLRSRTPSMISASGDPATPLSHSFSMYSHARTSSYASARPAGSPMLSVDPFSKAGGESFIGGDLDASTMHTAPESPSIYASSFFIPSPVEAKGPHPFQAPFEVKLSAYEYTREDSVGWAPTAMHTRAPESAARDELPDMEFHISPPISPLSMSPGSPIVVDSPSEQRTVWPGPAHSSAPSTPSTRLPFPISPLASSPASYRVAPPHRENKRSTHFFLPMRFVFSPTRALLPPAPGPAPTVPLPPTPTPRRATSPGPSSRLVLRIPRTPEAEPESMAGKPTRTRRRTPLRSARDWWLAGKRFAAAVAA